MLLSGWFTSIAPRTRTFYSFLDAKHSPPMLVSNNKKDEGRGMGATSLITAVTPDMPRLEASCHSPGNEKLVLVTKPKTSFTE